MHIADGFLSTQVCIGAGLLAAGAIGLSLRKLNETVSSRTVPLTGMMAALIFAAQMVNFPLMLAPASGHLLGGVLAAIVVGPWAGCVAISLVLFLQMALFADGGWLAYGANVLNMGVVGSLGAIRFTPAFAVASPGPRGSSPSCDCLVGQRGRRVGCSVWNFPLASRRGVQPAHAVCRDDEFPQPDRSGKR